MSINIIATIKPHEENKVKAIKAYNNLASIVQANEPDCLAFRVFNDPADGSIIIYKSYKHLDAWNAHRAQPWTRKAISEGGTQPDVHVYDGSMTIGFGPRGNDGRVALSTDSISIVATINPEDANKKAARDAISTLTAEVEANERGCLAFRVFNGADGSMIIYKSYHDIESWKVHRTMPWTQEALADCKVEPVIHVFDSSMTSGFGPDVERISMQAGMETAGEFPCMVKNEAVPVAA